LEEEEEEGVGRSCEQEEVSVNVFDTFLFPML
jgi:hypothetical protein